MYFNIEEAFVEDQTAYGTPPSFLWITKNLTWNTKKLYGIPRSSIEYQEVFKEYQGALWNTRKLFWNITDNSQQSKTNNMSWACFGHDLGKFGECVGDVLGVFWARYGHVRGMI